MNTRLRSILIHRGLFFPLLGIVAMLGVMAAHGQTPPVVANVQAAQIPGTEMVAITYDLADPDTAALNVSVEMSTNGGLSYTLPVWSATGAVGNAVPPGANKRIEWNAGVDWPSRNTSNLRFRVSATDAIPPTDMALVPAGSFWMGDAFGEGDANELPLHIVYVSAFQMDCYEVTKAKWDVVYNWATNNGYSFDNAGCYVAGTGFVIKGTNHPVHSANWYDAVKWCNARSQKEGRTPAYYTSAAQTVVYRTGQLDVDGSWVKWNAGYRLPTEAEWEKAARGGLNQRRFPWGDTITHSQANYYSHSQRSYDISPTRGYHPTFATGAQPFTSPVGNFAPNGYGLYDLCGNAWEFVWDRYVSGFYAWSNAGNDPRGPSVGDQRLVRGGSWFGIVSGSAIDSWYCRAAHRNPTGRANSQTSYGFRTVLPPGQAAPSAQSAATKVDTRDLPVTLSGRVVSPNGSPLAGATVTLGGQTVVTDANGDYKLTNVNAFAGNSLSISAAGYTSTAKVPQVLAGSLEMTMPNTDLRFREVTNRPVVNEILAQTEGIFIAGSSFPNAYTAVVDWNGFAPSHVEFYLNDTNHAPIGTVAVTGTEAKLDLDNGLAFPGSYTPDANTLLAVAVDGLGQRSDVYARLVAVIPRPTTLNLSPLAWDFLYDGWPNDPCIQRFKVKVPPDGFLDGFPMVMPLLETLGLHLEGEYKLVYDVRTGVWVVGRETPLLPIISSRMQPPYLNWGLWGPNFWANASASGYTSETQGMELDQVRVLMGIDGKALIFKIHFTDWLPPGPALNQVLDAFALIGVDINKAQRIDIYGLFGLQADLTWSCPDKRFTEAILTPGGGAEATYGIDLYAATLDTYVRGYLAFPIRVTSPQAWKVTGQVSLGLHVYVWHLVDESWDYSLLPWGGTGPGEIASSGNWGAKAPVRLPLLTGNGSKTFLEGVLVPTHKSGPRPMDRDYLNAGPARFVALDPAAKGSVASSSSQLSVFRQISRAPVKGSVAWTEPVPLLRDGPQPESELDGPLGETNQVDLSLMENIFPFARPAIASLGQDLMLLFVADNGSSNNMQFTEIAWTRWDGTNWSNPQAIRTNTQTEFSPQVKYDGNGDAIAVWERVADPNFTNVNVSALAAEMEIVWSRWNATNGLWSEPVAFTSNSYLDHAPLLCGPMANGKVLLVWTENEANLLMGTNGPGADRVWWCEWNPAGQSWSTPQELAGGLTYRLSQSFAGASNVAAFVWTQDADGVITNDTDQEIFSLTYSNGGWGAPIQFTPTGVPNRNVRLAAAPNGDLHLFWERNGELVMDRNFSGTNRTVRVENQTSGFTDYAATFGPAGNLVLLWQGMTTNGPDIHGAVYDPLSETWSRDILLSHDPALERSLAPVWDNVGNLTVAFARQQIVYADKIIPLEGGGQATITNAPQRGQTDLLVTKRALVKDLALEPGGFTVSGVNYLPGDPLTLTAQICNRGNVAMSNVVVGFYKGSPYITTNTPLMSVTIPGWFEAGATNQVSAVWQVPEPAAPHVLYAAVNFAGRTTEFNASNNVQSVSIGGTDLLVALVSHRPDASGAVRVLAQVHNLGAPKATNSVLAIRREGQTNSPLATVAVPALEPGQLAQVALDLPADTQPEGQAAYRLFADDTHRNSDVNTNNNTLTFVVNLWLDADGDGMPDGWENLYAFLNTTNAADAALDHDGDGLSNLAEYLAGTLPDDPLSYLKLTSITVGGTSGVQITWGSATNKFYTVQRTAALGGAGVFTNIAAHLPATPPENMYLDASATNSAAFFYRIQVE